MNKQLGKKARLRIDPIEQEYAKKYGKLPDYHYIELWHQSGGAAANKTVQDNMDAVWAEMKERNSPSFHPADNSPFHLSDNRTKKEGVTA